MTSTSLTSAVRPARRTVVAAAGAATLAAALTACGGSDDSGSDPAGSTASDSAGTEQGDDAAGDGGSAEGDAGGGTALAATSDIPEGGGKVFADQKVVVTQPSAGEFKAFSATCTHQGCVVKDVSDGVINCPCHNSNFSAADGSVRSGPAQKPLPAVPITVSGDSISLA
ncbi:Rieske (2Fe-2S) protein [Streptomyces ziwulingensis]|uniref:Cytochrome bc1 complex Rieske iron-sulfur subunit n=1 Tax=Streptomyces ziwulingensis TaxID=1045501 RepID=A0ABP9CSK8_9ACTN